MGNTWGATLRSRFFLVHASFARGIDDAHERLDWYVDVLDYLETSFATIAIIDDTVEEVLSVQQSQRTYGNSPAQSL